VKAPESLAQLVPFLTVNRHVTFTNFDGTVHQSTFARAEGSGLWFRRGHDNTEHFLPVNCRMTDASARAEAGVTFDAAGFTLSKFGREIRVDYEVERPVVSEREALNDAND
jgi:hypothetical protein